MSQASVKGLIVKIGGDTSELAKSLESVNKKSSSLSKELGEINRLLKLDPGNTDLLAQKQAVLANAIENTGNKLDTLREAEKQVQEQFKKGEVTEAQVRDLQREIIATEKKLKSYEKAAKETDDALENMGNEADAAGDDFRELAKNTAEAEKEAEELDSSLDGLGTGLGIVTAAVAAATAAMVACVEETREYRREMGKLDTAFTQNGHSSEAAKETYKELQGILGETDQAVEAANHLAKLCDTEAELAHWSGDILPGVYATFGASLPIEGLTEAANETAKTGALTGSLADALNWAGVNEEKFQESLDKCNSEQERQKLITETLVGLYGEASKAYKATNKEVIRANQANEEWTDTMADIGETMEPVLTDIKLFGAELLENAKEPMEDAAGFISDKLLPGLTSITSWVSSNGPTVKASLVGVTGAIVAFKVATIAAEVSQKGLKGAIMATTVAQKALSLAQAATPWGLVATAIAGVTAALLAHDIQVVKAKEGANGLTAEERKLMEASRETAQAFREQQAETVNTFGSIHSQMGYVTNLANELQTLADKSGTVKEKDQERVNFILNELNNALGTEYTMVDGVVQKYDELTKNINQVIQAKTANALLEAGNADFVAALEAERGAYDSLVLAEKDYTAQQDVVKQKKAELAAAEKAYHDADVSFDLQEKELALQKMQRLRGEVAEEETYLAQKKTAYDQAAIDYGNYSTTIQNYEDAQAAALAGNYSTAMDLLQGKSEGYSAHADVVDKETANVLDSLQKEAIDAGIKAENTRRNFENGVDGFTEEMVREAEDGYDDALDAYATAYDDAYGVGEDIGSGLSSGMESKRFSVIGKIKSIVSGIIAAAREAADSNSPSKETIALGEDMGDGLAIGMDHRARKAETSAENMVGAALTRSRELLRNSEDRFGGINFERHLSARRPAGATFSPQGADFSAMLAKLDGIYARLGRLKVLLDSKTVVGGIVDEMDAALGDKQRNNARGG